jgi:hypothetical protein
MTATLDLTSADVILGDLQAVADDVARTVSRRGSLRENQRLAYQIYVREESNPQLAGFAALLLRAPLAARCEQLKNDARHPAGLRDQWRVLVCQYNQLLGDFIRQHRQLIGKPEQLVSWLTRANGNQALWAKTIVTGMVAEMIGLDVVSAVAEDVTPASLADDLKGTDARCRRTAQGITGVDFKTGRYRPDRVITRRGNTLVLSLDPAHIDGFELLEGWVTYYQNELRKWMWI